MIPSCHQWLRDALIFEHKLYGENFIVEVIFTIEFSPNSSMSLHCWWHNITFLCGPEVTSLTSNDSLDHYLFLVSPPPPPCWLQVEYLATLLYRVSGRGLLHHLPPDPFSWRFWILNLEHSVTELQPLPPQCSRANDFLAQSGWSSHPLRLLGLWWGFRRSILKAHQG